MTDELVIGLSDVSGSGPLGRLPSCIPGKAHYWLLAPPDGPSTLARCKNCDNLRSFPNAMDRMSWREDS